jgi:hypothetical protein
MEKFRAQLEAGLNEATRKAYAQVGRSEAGRSEVGRPEISVSEKAGHG